MKSFMMNSDFHDIGSVVPRFTWCNNKEGTYRIWERLDICMLNSAASQKLPVATIKHLAKVASDHSPIVLNMGDKVQFKEKNFMFEDTWRSYPAAKSEKLKKEILELQNKEALGDNWSVDDLFVLRNKVHELNVTLRRLSTWWNQRAKARWPEEGDTNSKLFQNFASARRNGNQINQIRDEHNVLHDDEDQIEKKVTDEDMVMLNEDFSVNELQFLVFQQGNNKAPDVRFSITITGRKSKWIRDQGGFRQGCPLSPYLFILCSQLMSNSLEKRGQTLGIQIFPRGPKITHLLYADDVLIFSHASITLAKALKIIVEDFCKWTGQRVNVSKSQMLFDKVVSYSMKKKIARVLGFKVVKEMKYLGVKISLSRLNMADFQELMSNVMDRLNSWGKKSLSMGGKLTLIESSLFTMPNFSITHSLVPKRILHELEKLCGSFIWHKNHGTNGMHYIAWGEICKPRSMGGLGLHSPLLGIGSLRSKLAWNYIQKPNSLFHQTMKAKYGDDVMNGAQKKDTSSAWQIMLDGGKNLKFAVRWKVGKGDKINVLNDSWFLDKSINWWPTYVDYDVLDGIYVQQLLLNNGEWNLTLLYRAFHPDLILLIRQIHIEYEEEDRMELLKLCTFEDVEFYRWVQKLKLSKKVEIFWWRITENALCARGCQVDETYEHIMVHCKYMVEVIMKMCEWGILIPVFNSLDCCLHELKRLSSCNSGIVKVYCTIVYLSWKNQNDVKHGKIALPCSMVASNALFLATSKSSPNITNWGTNILRESQNTCSNLAGIGDFFRDHKGRLISAFGKKKAHWDIA
ncbi:uncharacterized protein LOC110109919 [Dendrobium catenatum]|uniref:uncharacterized protein LOC110109919 n=1 Tax=Dendrobium catenatum TaxID=906689 RepID=UPI0009F1E24A|nr:uncharacterized protein LOC110109919 [Dendrobium catenatum]